MMCEFKLLSSSAHGKVYMCSLCSTKLALMFGNISQCFNEDDFEDFAERLYRLKEDDYFGRHPNEEKAHLRTEVSHLYFSFTKDEVEELLELMYHALFKFNMIRGALSNKN